VPVAVAWVPAYAAGPTTLGLAAFTVRLGGRRSGIPAS
jgi:hypothetical protein